MRRKRKKKHPVRKKKFVARYGRKAHEQPQEVPEHLYPHMAAPFVLHTSLPERNTASAGSGMAWACKAILIPTFDTDSL